MNEPVASYTEEQVAQIIRAHIDQEFLFRTKDSGLADDDSLIARGVIDSMGIFRLVNFLEQRFEISVSPPDIVMENFRSLQAIRAFTVTRLRGRDGQETD
ncbi:acyl carrier protein [Myxococcus sp. CA040A]|uniref:acyl carrier protein n=1 Tax=Myxococcus sp. CA040A TaxID=2741738 RepID=UPI00157A5179|nr:acyl carrier protein [Myxococcus sp. CA040A]